MRRGTNNTTTFVAFPLWLFSLAPVSTVKAVFCHLSCFLQTIHRCVAVLNWEMDNLTRTLENSNSWVSRDVIISLGSTPNRCSVIGGI